MAQPPGTPPVPPETPSRLPSGEGPAKRRSCWFYGCGSLLLVTLLIVAAVLITLWWVRRPIKPVVLSAPEKAAVEEKLRKVGITESPSASPRTSLTDPAAPSTKRTEPVELPDVVTPEHNEPTTPNSRYAAGGKVLKLTEREINGLLNANTDLGKSVRIEFDRDAINAYLAVRIPDDFPIAAGKMFRARGRFKVSLGNGGQPYAVLEDVTVWGLSLPKAWLGGIKGENLLGEAMTGRDQSPILKGVKSLRVEPGALVLEVND